MDNGVRKAFRAIFLLGGTYMSARGVVFTALDTYDHGKSYFFETPRQVEEERPVGEILKSLDRKLSATNSFIIGFTGLGLSYILRKKSLETI